MDSFRPPVGPKCVSDEQDRLAHRPRLLNRFPTTSDLTTSRHDQRRYRHGFCNLPKVFAIAHDVRRHASVVNWAASLGGYGC